VLTLLLPARANLEGDLAAAPALARVLARADADAATEGDEAQVQRVFDVLPRGLPVAALTRQYDCNDAMQHTWLRADPAHLRADLGSGRMMACGELGLSREQAEELLQPLKPVFGDAGCPISAGSASRWYVSLPRDAKLPAFAPPSRVLGDDIYPYLPDGDLGRRWRRLLSEAQVVLHNHPLNAQRIAAGQVPVNSLWFWGGGVLPDHVRSVYRAIYSDDLLLAAMSRQAANSRLDLPSQLPALASQDARFENTLIDLRRVRSLARIEADWVVPALALQTRRGFDELQLDFADGALRHYRHAHRWRFWRRRPTTLA
jgi:hypothetical protein